MGKEIERKFLIKGDAWHSLAEGTKYRQGYLNSSILVQNPYLKW